MSIDAKYARVHLSNQRAANSATPTEFCAALRRRIEGGRVDCVVQVGLDRIVEIGVVTDSIAGKKAYHKLIVELMGKHSNLILVDYAGRIIESARRVSHRINRVRETLPGLKYVRPPGLYDGPLPSLAQIAESITERTSRDLTPETVAAAVRACAPFVSPFLAAEIAFRSTCTDEEISPYQLKFGDGGFAVRATGALIDRIHSALDVVLLAASTCQLLHWYARGAGVYPVPVMQVRAEQQELTSSINDALGASYAELMQRVQKQEAADRLLGQIDKERARQARVETSLTRTIEEASRADILSQNGELLLANLWQIKPGALDITVTDYYDVNGSNRTIRLNPEFTPQQNAEAMFDKARRSRLGLETARARLRKTSEAVAALINAVSKLLTLIDDPTAEYAHVREMEQSLNRDGLLRETPKQAINHEPQFQGHRIRREVTPEGYEILFGESSTANDYLTTRVARPDDLWLHVRSATGGHVVIRTLGKPENVPERVLERAAIIGALHSAQKHSSLVAVDYTLKKYVRKPRGAAPGAVVIEREKTRHVSPTAADRTLPD